MFQGGEGKNRGVDKVDTPILIAFQKKIMKDVYSYHAPLCPDEQGYIIM